MREPAQRRDPPRTLIPSSLIAATPEGALRLGLLLLPR